MLFFGIKIEKVTAIPSNPAQNQFYLVEFEGVTQLYLSDSSATLQVMTGIEALLIRMSLLEDRVTTLEG